MKTYIKLLLAFYVTAVFAADVKLSQLPLGTASSAVANDSFPYVNSVTATTQRLKLYDLVNVPAFVSTYAPLLNPTFTGIVTAPTFVGNLTGTASGNTSYTPSAHGVVLSSGNNAMTVLTPNASTALPLVSGGVSADPSWVALTVPGGGTGRTTLTNHGVLIGAATSGVTQLAVAGTGTVLIGQSAADPAFSVNLGLGSVGGGSGTVALSGNTSGTITIQTQAAAGTYNFNLPITAGNAGQVLTSQAGGGTAMTWVTPLSNPMTTTGDTIYSSDNSGTPARLPAGTTPQVKQMWNGLPSWQTFQPPVVQLFTSGSAYTLTYSFVLSASASLSQGWTYSNNSKTCTVAYTTASSTNVLMTCTGDPTETTSGTLTCVSCGATGNRTYTYWVKPKYIEVIACGGGGGGGASTSPSGGSAGGTTTFGSTIISCTGGSLGSNQASQFIAAGGSCTLTGVPSATSMIVLQLTGQEGSTTTPTVLAGFTGGSTPVGFGGVGGVPSVGNGHVGSGFCSGGGGAGDNGATNTGGGGGGAGGYVDIYIYNPLSAGYAFSIGGPGTAQSGTRSGGPGATGVVIVKEFYQ